MGAPTPLEGSNPYTGMYQSRQFGTGYQVSGSQTPFYIAQYLANPPADLVTAMEQTPLVEEAEFFDLLTQVVTVTGSPASGSFALQYDIDFTAALPYNATAAAVQAALNGLGSIGGTSSVQTVTIGGSPTGGTFTLSFAGQTTAGIAYNAAASDVQTALEALSTIGSGNVSVSGPTAGPYAITFTGTLGYGPRTAVTGSAASLTGGSPTLTVAQTTTGVAPVTVAGSNGGPWTVTFGSSFQNEPVQLIRTRNVQLPGDANVVVTTTGGQQGIMPF